MANCMNGFRPGYTSCTTQIAREIMVFKTTELPCRMATWWLTTEESKDTELLSSLKPKIRQYQRKGYVTATFFSGNGDLESSTHQLMKHNFQLHAASSSLAPDDGCKAVSICCKCCHIIPKATFILIVALGREKCYNVARKINERSGQH